MTQSNSGGQFECGHPERRAQLPYFGKFQHGLFPGWGNEDNAVADREKYNVTAAPGEVAARDKTITWTRWSA